MSVNTNGFLINDDIAEFLVNLPFDSISISIDATTSETLLKTRGTNDLDKLKESVFKLLKYRGDKNRPRIGVSFILEEVNSSEKDDFINYWLKYVDVVRVSSFIDQDSHSSWSTTTTIPSKRIPCPLLYEEMTVNFNGDIPICCHDSFCKYKMGNVFEDGVKNVWHGENFNRVRTLHENGNFDQIDICKNCDVWSENIFFEQEEKEDIIIKRSYTTEFYNRKDKLYTLDSDFGYRGIQTK